MAGFQSPVLDTLSRLFKLRAKKSEISEDSRGQAEQIFRQKYLCFQELLESNAELLKIVSDMEVKLSGQEIFGSAFIRSQTSRAVFHALRMIKSFEGLSGRSQPELLSLVSRIQINFKDILSQNIQSASQALALRFCEIDKQMSDLVGGKNANLGEIHSRVGLAVPEGFAVTTFACRKFLEQAQILDEIARKKLELDPRSPESLQQISEDIQHMILMAALPEDIEQAILDYQAELAKTCGLEPEVLRVSLRSSAIGEDSELSFAGQYLSVLNVSRERLATTYKYIVASLYTPRAISYRLLKGIPEDGVMMSVACMRMVESRSAGVMYTRHPFNLLKDEIIINALWGLGPYVVDGVVKPDTYRVSKPDCRVLEVECARKEVKLICNAEGGLSEVAVEPEMSGLPALNPLQICELARLGLKLEEHYGQPQDVEWALDAQDKLYILQSRPLALSAQGTEQAPRIPLLENRELVFENAAVACPGIGLGKVFVVADEDDLSGFPENSVLVAAHSSPKFMVLMQKAQAILTDFGSLTGHMASLSREFAVPTLMDLKDATTRLKTGEEISVDAYSGRVYRGIAPELREFKPLKTAFMKDTLVYAMLKQTAELITPLRLLNPAAKDFGPGACRSLHDLMRLLHELSYSEMFKISDTASASANVALKLRTGVGLDLYIIDLGGGLSGRDDEKHSTTPQDVTSRPFKALLEGMLDENFHKQGPRPVHLKGFFSVMGRQLMDQPDPSKERFGDKSYALISDKYLNFSSRIGYHYSVLDCYCGQNINNNYISFAFKGGAADDARRERRARAISLILRELGFSVKLSADRVEGRVQKREADYILERLLKLGKLLQYTRQTDMLMVDEASVRLLAENFLKGNYSLDFAKPLEAKN